jgi:general secretion pathway protein I
MLVALAVVAVALTAGMRALAQSADGAGTLKARTLALWVAQNRLATVELARELPPTGIRRGEATQAGLAFVWRENVGATPNPAFRRVDVEVAEAVRARLRARAPHRLRRRRDPAMKRRAASRSWRCSSRWRSSRCSRRSPGRRPRRSSTARRGCRPRRALAAPRRGVRAPRGRRARRGAAADPRRAAARACVRRRARRVRVHARGRCVRRRRRGARLAYRQRGDTLEIAYWPRLDRVAGVEPAAYPLASDIARVELRYVDDDGATFERWPPREGVGLPRALAIGVTLGDGLRVDRLVVLR